MNGRVFVATTIAFAIASSLPVFGDTLGYYTPPNLVKQGTATTPLAG